MRNVSALEYFTHVSIRITTFAECRLPVSKIQVLFAIVAAIVNREQNTIIDSCKSYVLKKVYIYKVSVAQSLKEVVSTK